MAAFTLTASSLSLTVSCFLSGGSLPRPLRRGLAAAEAWPPEGKQLERAEEDADRKDSGVPPHLQTAHTGGSSSLSSVFVHPQTSSISEPVITELNKVKVQLQTRRRRRTLFPPTVGAQTAVKDKDRFSSVKVKSDLFVAHFMHRTIQSASYKIKALQQGAEKALKICKMI